MKKIIAAALSILVGAFGYTIVDSAIEDRVATLESEIVELREEVSRYHPNYSSNTTTRKTTSITSRPTSTINDSYWQPTTIGSFLEESSNTMRKFLLRKWSTGRVQYISPSIYGDSVSQFAVITDPPDGRLEPTTKQGIISTINSTQTAKFTTNNGITDPDDGRITLGTTTALTYEEHFLYVIESTAQLTDILEDVSYSYYYNNDYSMISTAFTKVRYPINVKCKGYTDPSFAGKQIVFSVSWIGNSRPDIIMSNTINADGSFEYEAIYSASHRMFNYDAFYSLSSISVN